jgi:hypothetical protein
MAGSGAGEWRHPDYKSLPSLGLNRPLHSSMTMSVPLLLQVTLRVRLLQRPPGARGGGALAPKMTVPTVAQQGGVGAAPAGECLRTR